MTSFAKLRNKIKEDTGCVLPNEILLKVFDYLNISDLKKCSLVSKNWYSLSNHRAYWLKWAKILKIDKELDLLMKSEKTLSLKISFKHIFSQKRDLNLLKLNAQLNKRMNNYTMLPDLKQFLIQNKIVLKWIIEFYDNKNKTLMSIESNEKNIFESSKSVIWSNLAQLAIKTVQYIKVFTLIPVYVDLNNGKLTNCLTGKMKDSIDLNSSNKILVYETKFNLNLLKNILHEDALVKLYNLNNLLIGIWSASKHDLAFITFNTTFNFSLKGKEKNPDTTNNSKDLELDRNFGLHDYKIYFCIRNQTNTIFLSLNKTIYKTSFETLKDKQKYLLLNVVDSDMSESDLGYHLNMMPKFTWSTEGFQKNIINLLSIIDLNILDSNNKIMISDSFPVKFKSSESSSNFVSDSFFEITYSCDKRYVVDTVISHQQDNSYLSKLNIYLDLNLVDTWFGTNFLSKE